MIERGFKMTGSEMVTRALEERGVAYELLTHPAVDTALAEARVLHVPPEEVAKTVVLSGPEGYFRAVLPASERLDLRKVRDALGGEAKVRLATEDELRRDYAEFELGAVPPFAGRRDEAVLLDARLRDHESLVVEAGTGEASVRLRTAELIRLLGAPVVADLCSEDER
jgi:Ala-tRNA(Pro) deacylase